VTIEEALAHGAQILSAAGNADPRRDSALLIAHAIAKDKVFLIAHPEYTLTETQERRFRIDVERRASRTPFQHITGEQQFYGLDFTVTPDVLVPRPETEMLVTAAIDTLQRVDGRPKFLEIGVGSGCISVSVLKNVESAKCVGTDISAPALGVASANARRHGVEERCDLLTSDVFEAISDHARFDLIVSNPPYIPLADVAGLQSEVRDHDPLIALTDGGDGLGIVRRIIYGAPRRLKDRGTLLVEMGYGQAEMIAEMFDPAIWESVSAEPDLQGIPRMFHAGLRSS
jgi:release factor glutamine methyltransferase